VATRKVKIWKQQEGQEVIGLPRGLIAYSPLRFCRDQGRSLRIVDGGGELMEWARILAHITGTVDQELLLCNEYLVAENPKIGS
jgi:hypothetical protein